MKYSKIKLLTILSFSALFLFSTCESEFGETKNFLEKYPLDNISSKSFWKSASDLELYMNQFYPDAFTPTFQGKYTLIFSEDVESDDMLHVQVNRRLEGSRVVPQSGGWDYSEIRDLNVFLENYQKVEEDFDNYKQYVGEAHFFRAYYYFNLVKTYGAVPWIGKVVNTESEELYKPQTPRNQVVDSIIADLDKAIGFLPQSKQAQGTRLNEGIAQLFKSRVCLYEGTWEKYHANDPFGVDDPNSDKYFELAYKAAEDLMESGVYGVYGSSGRPEGGPENGDYFNLFGRVDYSNNPEVMLWAKYNLDLAKGHARQFLMGEGYSGGVGITRSFVESYLCEDGDPIYLSEANPNPLYQGDDSLGAVVANRDPRIKQTIFTPGFPLKVSDGDTVYFDRPAVDRGAHEANPTGYQQNKFLNLDNIHHYPSSTQNIGYTGWIVMRYAEALLNYAEAKAELGIITQTDIDKSINLLRDRVGMPDLVISEIKTDPNWSFPDLSPIINEIRRERRVELIGEGFRWDDIARWAAADELIVDKRPRGAKFNDTDYPDLNPENFKLTNGYFDPLKDQIPNGYGFNVERDYLSPVPTEELTLNNNIEQNPRW